MAAGVELSLTLCNSEAARYILTEPPRLVPNKRIKSESTRTYDARKFNAYALQGIIQGKSVYDIATAALNGMVDTERCWAMNNAITAMTSAENAGAIYQMQRAESMGIGTDKRWNSTLDYHTRPMHRLLDQQVAPLDEPFRVNGYEIQYPGDPNAAPEMVYHCRCKLTAALLKYPRQNAMRRDNVSKGTVSDMIYTEWYKAKGGTETEQMWWTEAHQGDKIKSAGLNADGARNIPGRSNGESSRSDETTTVDFVGVLDFSDKREINKQLFSFLEKYNNSPVEHAVVFSPDGHVYHLTGAHGNVNTLLIGQESLNGSIGAHSHPVWDGFSSGDSFSLEDVLFSIEYKTGTEFLTTGNRRYSFEYTGSLTCNEIEAAYKTAMREVLSAAFEDDRTVEFIQLETMRLLAKKLEGFNFNEIL